MSTFYALKVKAIKRQTEKAVQISFEVPKELKSTFSFKPGQYITLASRINGEDIRRSYSICSLPSEDLSVVVKAIPDGVFSNFVNSNLELGHTLDVMPPEGHFIVEHQDIQSNYCAFVAGSGITPVMSILKSILENNGTSKFILVYGNKSPKETIFFNELIELQAQFSDRLFIEHIYSQTQEDNAHFGRIEKPTINYILKNKYAGIDIENYFLCGPEPMIDLACNILKEQGIEETNIKYELFYSEKKGEEIENTDGITLLKVIVDDEEHELTMQQDKAILDAVLEKDIDVPYSCQGGICSSCIAVIKEGKAVMSKNQILTDKEVEQGLILTCQAHPQTPVVVVDYDDI